MTWTKNEALLSSSSYTPPKAIFQGVCDELGAHYKELDFRYARSRPKITFKNKLLKLEICFWSSGSNMAGSFTNLEILPNLSSLELAKKDKDSGLMLGHIPFYIERLKEENPKLVRVQQVYGDYLEREENEYKEAVVMYNRNCNLYGIDEVKFKQIIHFIDNNIIYWIERLSTKEGALEFITKLPEKERKKFKRKDDDFGRYLKLTFPEVNWEEYLGVK